MTEHLITHVPEHLRAKPSVEIEVVEVHTSDKIEVTASPEYIYSSVYHVPTIKAIGRAAVEVKDNGSFRGDPSTVPGTDAYKQRQQEIANFAHSESVTSNAHSRQY